MSAPPEVAITIMTGGSPGAAASASTSAPSTGPEPMPLDQLARSETTGTTGASTGARSTGPEPMSLDRLAAATGDGIGGGGGAPTPEDLSVVDGAEPGSGAPTPSQDVSGVSTSEASPTPLDLDALAQQVGRKGGSAGTESAAKRAARADS